MGQAMQPIRSQETVNRITRELSRDKSPRGNRRYLLWVVGINMGMRISDMVDLKVGDLRDQTGYTYIPHKQEHKKGVRSITIPVPEAVRRVVKSRCAGMADGDWLFPSRKKKAGAAKAAAIDPERRDEKPRKRERAVNPGAIGRQTARMEMQEIGKICGLNMRIGCHTMRKTFGYHYYQATHNIAVLQEWFYHENPATTLIYIGVQFDNFADMIANSPFSLEGAED